MSEAGADLVGPFDTFEAMVRANGRSPTFSWLLVTLFCDVFGMNRSVYIDFPRDRTKGNGWDQVVLRLPCGRIYIAPHTGIPWSS